MMWFSVSRLCQRAAIELRPFSAAIGRTAKNNRCRSRGAGEYVILGKYVTLYYTDLQQSLSLFHIVLGQSTRHIRGNAAALQYQKTVFIDGIPASRNRPSSVSLCREGLSSHFSAKTSFSVSCRFFTTSGVHFGSLITCVVRT